MRPALVTLLLLSATHGALADITDSKEDEAWNVSEPPYSVDARTADINVQEGTWMSLDVSPDGKTIVFDLLGDIYQIPFEGGKARPIRSGHAWEMQPQFSPDGESIAFTSDIAGGENIWVMKVGTGEAHQVTKEEFRLLNNPTWSPDGKYIAARKHFTTSRSLGTGEIWLYHVEAGTAAKGVQIVERPDEKFQKELGEPAFAPGGDFIYYTQNVTRGNTFVYHQDTNKEVMAIKRVDLVTGETSKVVGGPGGAVRPTPSPDGHRLAYIKRVRAASRLFIMNLDTGLETMVVDRMDQDVQETWGVQGMYPNMEWTPDSKELVYWAGGKIWRVNADGGEPINIPFAVEDTRSIYPSPQVSVEVAPDTFETKMVRFASPNPDGRSIVFESLGQLFVKKGDGLPAPLTDGEAGFDHSPVWSPDGDRVYFIRWNDQKLSSIHTIRIRGGKSKLLSREKGQYEGLSISADGKVLVYQKLKGNTYRHSAYAQNPGIYLMDVKSGDTQFVSKKGTSPAFAPDGRILINYRKPTTGRDSSVNKTELLSMTRQGLDERRIAESAYITRFNMSPDGKQIAFIENHHIYVSLLPPIGKAVEIGREHDALPTKRLSQVGGKYLRWSPDSTQLSWSVGAEFKTATINEAMFKAKDNIDITSVNLSQVYASATPTGTLAITGADIITMNSDTGVIKDGTILIEGNRIIAVGNKIDIPSHATRMDAQGKTIMPGMIDAHAHGSYGTGEIIPQQNWNALAHLALGVTTVHNPSSRASQAFAAAEYARAGRILSPRIFSTGEIVYGAKSTSWAPVDSLDDALSHVRRLKAQGAFSIKNYNQPRRNQRQQVIEAVRQEGMMTVSEGGSLYHLDMNMIADGASGIEHNVPVLTMYDDVTQFWQQSDAGYTPTLVVTYNGLTSEDYYYQKNEVWKHPILSNFVPPSVLQPRSVRRLMAPEEDYRDDDSAASAKVLLEAGILVNSGGHGQREGLAIHWEMWSFRRGGMTPMQALSTSTINPARYLGMDQDLGSIEPGKLADLVILNANPLDDIENSDDISHVVLNGRIYQAKDLKEVVTGNRTLQPFWWQSLPQSSIR